MECSGIHYGWPWQDKYDKGFGNWAVNSNYGREMNGFQFAGWRSIDGLLQWQSCTRKLPKPDCQAYNDKGCTGQKAVPDNERKYGGLSFFFRGSLCSSIGVHSADPLDMHIVELDSPDGDEEVSDLIYGGVDVPLTCSDAWRCRGDSAWLYDSDGDVSAEVQIRVRTDFRELGR